MSHTSPDKIMMIRHAEKPAIPPPPHGVLPDGSNDHESLSVAGWTRAGALVGLFAPSSGQFADLHFATPQLLYAVHVASDSDSRRSQQTIAPLLARLGDRGRANFDFAKGQEAAMIASVLAQSGIVLICWEHRLLADAAKHIPLSPNNTLPIPESWDGERFDLVWVFDRDGERGGYLFTSVPQLLLAGDRRI